MVTTYIIIILYILRKMVRNKYIYFCVKNVGIFVKFICNYKCKVEQKIFYSNKNENKNKNLTA